MEAILKKQGITKLRPAQQKAIDKGLLDGKNQLICTPTASGKTLIAEMAFLKQKGKTIYIVPLKALATEKYKDFKKKYGENYKIALAISDFDSDAGYLADYDMIICTSEKLDSLLRHHAPWISSLTLLVIDEIHLLNDQGRGPTLEILITMLRTIIPNVQIIGLSATIGNPKELSNWLSAELIEDSWRPVELKKGIYHEEKLEFY